MNILVRGAAVSGIAAAAVLVGAGLASAAPTTTAAGGPGKITVTTTADYQQADCFAWIKNMGTGQTFSKSYTANVSQSNFTRFTGLPAGNYFVDWSCTTPGPGGYHPGSTNVTVTERTPLDEILELFGS